MRIAAAAIFLSTAAGPAQAEMQPQSCRAEIAAAELPTMRISEVEGDLRFRMPGIEFEALARCRDARDASRVGLVQVLLDYRVEARYEEGRLEVRAARLPAIDALDNDAPWYPAIRREEPGGKVRLSAYDAPAGFMELRQAFVSDGRLSRLEGLARFVTFVAYRREDGQLEPLVALEWESRFTTERGADGTFKSSGPPARYRAATEGEVHALVTVQRANARLARRETEWWWVPDSGAPARRVAAMR